MLSTVNVTKLLSIPLVIALLIPQSSSQTVGRKTQPDQNDNELNDEFALEKGPRFLLPRQQQAVVDQVIEEMKKGYGGTLVTKKGPDDALDSSFFLSRYLREFSSPENKSSLKDYDYRFERILARASEYPTMLDDPRLDWDLYRALLLYGNSPLAQTNIKVERGAAWLSTSSIAPKTSPGYTSNINLIDRCKTRPGKGGG